MSIDIRATQPADSRIDVVEASSDRIVLALPAGGPKTKSLGVMALIWNGMMLWGLGFLLFVSAEMSPVLLGLPVLTLFVIIGWYLAGSWIALKLTRTNVLITRTEVATQKILFGFKDLDTAGVHPETRARLVESYSSNGKAVFSVRVNGSDDSVSFGTPLSREDKDWMVDAINGFFGQESPEPALSSGDSGSEVAWDFVELDPSDLPDNSVVSVQQPSPDQMVLSSPSFPGDQFRKYAIAGLLAVFVLWVAVGVWHCTIPGLTHMIAGIVMLVISVAPLVLIAFTLFGTITTTIDPNRVTTKYHLGWPGVYFKRPTATAERVSVETSNEATDETGWAGTIIQLGQSRLLAGWGTIRTCRQIAGLVRYHLRQLGIETMDVVEDEGRVG